MPISHCMFRAKQQAHDKVMQWLNEQQQQEEPITTYPSDRSRDPSANMTATAVLPAKSIHLKAVETVEISSLSHDNNKAAQMGALAGMAMLQTGIIHLEAKDTTTILLNSDFNTEAGDPAAQLTDAAMLSAGSIRIHIMDTMELSLPSNDNIEVADMGAQTVVDMLSPGGVHPKVIDAATLLPASDFYTEIADTAALVTAATMLSAGSIYLQAMETETIAAIK